MVLPNRQLRELALFAGAGGGILGGKLLWWRTRCAVEIDPYCREVLLSRQRDGVLPIFPIWDDIRTFDGKQWRGSIDVVSGGFPCTDISAAGTRKGLAGESSGLWFEMLRVIGEVRPSFVFVENSPHLRTRGLGTVLEGLAGLGYDARWCVLGAWHVGAPHRRNRMWIVAYLNSKRGRWKSITQQDMVSDLRESPQLCNGKRKTKPELGEIISNYSSDGWNSGRERNGSEQETRRSASWWAVEPDVERVVYGLPNRLDRIKALGNAQVPLVAATAWRILTEDLEI